MKKKAMLLMAIFTLIASEVSVKAQLLRVTLTGTVKTIREIPVDGALVFVDGLETNSRTNRRGSYKIKITQGTHTIAVYSDTEGSEEVSFSGQEEINFILTGSFNAGLSLDQQPKELIDIGYGEIEREKVSTSIGSLDEERTQRRQYSNIFRMIQAQVPGVQVIGERIIIRGIHTNTDNSQPVFVVDGVTVSSISHINPQEVESIDILKGPAGSIYGLNGANGVIIIKLKK